MIVGKSDQETSGRNPIFVRIFILSKLIKFFKWTTISNVSNTVEMYFIFLKFKTKIDVLPSELRY